jgi:Luciferase-like monooxygenase
VKVGLGIVATNWDGGAARLSPTLVEIVEAAEAARFDVISVSDHVWGSQYTGGVEASQVEAYTVLGFIAARTRRVRLAAMATAVSYRHAGLLAKIVTTLDVLSGGPCLARHRLGRLRPRRLRASAYRTRRQSSGTSCWEETVQACLRMWAGEQGDQRPFHGKHVRMERALNVPQSLSRPHPPILIAGGGGATHSAAGRPLRRRLQHPAGTRAPAQARPPEAPLRPGGPRLRCDREDGPVLLRRRPGRLEGRRAGRPATWAGRHGRATLTGWVIGQEKITPIEIMGREVIPAVAGL